MPALIIDGKAKAAEVEAQLKSEIEQLTPKLGRAPALAVVLVGENPASRVYVKSKTKRATKIGIDVEDVILPADLSNEKLAETLQNLSKKNNLDGILLQLPLPNGLDEYHALLCITPSKDVDGLHPVSQGLLLRGEAAFRPCTPLGVMSLIDQAQKDLNRPETLAGLRAVVVGRSVLVGKPMAFLLLERHCTVSVCHSRTKDLAAECRSADILIAAVGREELIQEDWIKPGAIVIDVGINRNSEGKLVGDVHFEGASKTAGAITPVPGGVGPMTIAMLLSNTVLSAKGKIVS